MFRSRSRWFVTAFAALAAAVLFALPLRSADPKKAEGPAPPDAKATDEAKAAALEKDVTQGALRMVKDDATIVECPLKHTDVKAEISGFIARVNVTQTFHNPTNEKIEAVYVFPLPHEAAVDDMTMVVGERKIVGIIKRRDEARRIYEQALLSGQTAALLEQERPNIFTQSVGNIEPGQEIHIQISYVDVLRYDLGTYEFSFPLVVGPRYSPGAPASSPQPAEPGQRGIVAPPPPNTTRVPDASRITPPVLRPGFRNGHDISLAVSLDAGVPIQNLGTANHKVQTKRDGDRRATIQLSPEDSVPNKDFVLRYEVQGDKPEMAVLAHTNAAPADARRLGEGYFMLMIQPRKDARLEKSPPREMVFLVDVSGSMSGEPTAKVIETMREMLRLCRAQDTVQVITFASRADKLFEKPVPVNDANIRRALGFTEGLKGGGGTEMLKGVKLAIDEPIDQERVRIVVMLTDGYIGNEAEIIEHVGKNTGDQVRFWCIGVGSSPNMFLVDGVARQGGGMGKRLDLKDDAVPLTQEIMSRIQRAQLAKVSIDWGSLNVAETFPSRIPELWAGRPIIVYGRYAGGDERGGDAWKTRITINGSVEGEAVSWPLAVSLPVQEPGHDVLAKVWARQKIEDLMQQSYYAGSPAVEEEVTALALDYRLMSQYTSFVAVDARDGVKIEPGARPPRRMQVPVPLPEGTRWEGFFGPDGDFDGLAAFDDAPTVSGSIKSKPASGLRGLAEAAKAARPPLFTPRPLIPAPANGPSAREQLLKRYGGTSFAGSGGGADRAYKAVKLEAIYGGDGAGRHRLMEQARRMPFAGSRPGFAFDRAEADGGWTYGNRRGNDLFRADLSNSYLVVAAMAGETAGQDELARNALTEANELAAKDQPEAARAAYLRAYFLDAAAANFGHTGRNTAAEALAALEVLREKQQGAWVSQLPALARRLELVIRDQSLDEALAAVAKAAGLDVRIIAGSLEDSASLNDGEPVRFTYLDLRHATAAQALDWMCRNGYVDWRLEGNAISVSSARRVAGHRVPWVYDVADMALPDVEELQKLNDDTKARELAGKAAADFADIVRQRVAGEGVVVTWHAPGRLIVVGTDKAHAAAAGFIAQLADPKAKFEGDAATLHAVASKRAADRREKIEKARAASRAFDVAAAHEVFAWRLLASAAGSQLDDEAFTELSIAWRQPATAELLKGPAAVTVLRSLWAVCEASAAVPESKELAALAESSLARSSEARQAAFAALEKNADDAENYTAALYGALALRASGKGRPHDPRLAAVAKALVSGKAEELATARVLAGALLGPADASHVDSLVKVVEARVDGSDATVLTALACRRVGGEAWRVFRASSRDVVGDQPLPGSVVVLINRLGGRALPIAVAEAK